MFDENSSPYLPDVGVGKVGSYGKGGFNISIDANMNAANWSLLMGRCYSASAWLESNTRRKVLLTGGLAVLAPPASSGST